MHRSHEPLVYLAYAAADKVWAAQFSTALRDAGVKLWFDAAEIRPGDEWKDATERALRDSDILVFVLTPNSVDNPWALFELGAAVADNKRVIPIVAKPFDPSETPPLIGRYRFLDESSPTEAARRVAEVVAEPA